MQKLILLTLLGLAACLARPSAPPVHLEIGAVTRPVSTRDPEAQLWFDRGLALCFGFNHEEAVLAFRRAAKLDPALAMAHWGEAYALAPNYNSPVLSEEASAGAHAALERALARLDGASPVERGLILATRARFARPEPADRSQLDRAYAEAMRALCAEFPDDADVAALTAEALMQLRPWKLWSAEGVPAPETPEIVARLDAAIARWPEHPLLCHLHIHALEASPRVADALPSARRLENLTPGLGHLVHMPSHIYVWTGHYDDVVRVNEAAVAVDDAYVAHAGRHNGYTLYRVHNLHFIVYGGMLDGRAELALAAARRIAEEIPPELVRDLADLTEIFLATPYHVLVRFGRWEELLREPEPAPEHLGSRAVWHYARGVALASLGRVDEARAEEQLFRAAKAAVPASRLLFQNPVASVLAVAELVLAGEIAYRAGESERAFTLLREAVALDRSLAYDEPWGWMQPVEHALGALLVDQGRFDEALAVYESNLRRYPENGWALNGMAECLDGLGRAPEAERMRARFERAWVRADTSIPGSCFCRVRPEVAALGARE